MTKRMLIDATHEEEVRVAVMDGNRLDEFDYESKYRKPLKGSIFLAKVTRVEPSLQAAFVNFGGNRHGFLPFSEIHPDYFRIPISDREALIAEQEAAMQEHEEEEDIEGDDVEEEGAKDAAIDSNISEAEDVVDDVVEQIGGDEAASNDASDDSEDSDDDGPQPGNEAEPEEGEDPDGNKDETIETRGNSRGGRGRRHGRRGHNGRGGRRRSQHRSRNVETFGGEEFEDEDNGFRFNLRRKYKIQEVVKRGQIMLVQVSKEERGNKGAAVSSYLSLPGRYCVLMPNSPRGGGVSRKIASYKDRARMRDMLKEMDLPKGMSVIVRTAGVSRTKAEIKRDLDYLMRLWDSIRELTLQSSAPAMVYEEADLIKRAVRDLYSRDVEEVLVDGEEGFKTAKNFMKMMIPSHVKRVKNYEDSDSPLFSLYNAEAQIAEIGEAQVTLPSGGYLVINPTEALVSVDVNSGRATKERHIEETALKTNLEAATEVARQLRLRDLGGLVVIDFIDMEDRRNNGKVERRMRDALSADRARIQMGRISSFGLMEMSRQRLSPSLTESQFEVCSHCAGVGRIRSSDSTAIMVLRAIEAEGARGRASQLIAHVSNSVSLYILNNKRQNLADMEVRFGFSILIRVDETLGEAGFRVEVSKPSGKPDAQKDGESEGKGDEAKQKSPRRRGRRGGRRRGGRDENRSLADDLNADVDADADQNEKKEKDERGSRKTRSRPKVSDEGKSKDETSAKTGKEEKPKRGGRKPAANKKTVKDKDEKKAEKTEADSKKSSSRMKKSPKDEVEVAAEKPAPKRKKEPASNDDGPSHAREFETINETPKEKKRGWWSRGES